MKRDTDFNSQPPEYVKDWYREFIFGYLEPDGIFMLRLLSSNTSDFVCTEVRSRFSFERSRTTKICLLGHQSSVASVLPERSEATQTQAKARAGRRTVVHRNQTSNIRSCRPVGELRLDPTSQLSLSAAANIVHAGERQQ